MQSLWRQILLHTAELDAFRSEAIQLEASLEVASSQLSALQAHFQQWSPTLTKVGP